MTSTDTSSATSAATAAGWDCHVHVFDAEAPIRPGHYTPVQRTLDQIERLAAGHGMGHLVLVQPSVYGHDNSVMLRALAAGQGRHRGVAVVDATATDRELDSELDRLHAAGVRGLRFNLVSPAGHAGNVAADLRRLAPRLRERCWHVQFYVLPEALPRVVNWQGETGLCFVLDHMAGLNPNLPDADPAWVAARTLADNGAWIKLSGWYRLAARQPYATLQPSLQRVALMFGPRTVWGSDWPHTSFPPDQLPTFESNLTPVRDALGEVALATIVCDHARSLYFEGPP